MWVSTVHTLVVPRLYRVRPITGMDVRHPRGCPQRLQRRTVWEPITGDYACQVHAVLDTYGTDDFHRPGERAQLPWAVEVTPGKHQIAAWLDPDTCRVTLRLLADPGSGAEDDEPGDR